MTDEKYIIRRILKARKMKEEDKMEYLVEWEPTWVYKQDMDVLPVDYQVTVVVLGPAGSQENLQKPSIKYMDLVVHRRKVGNMSAADEVTHETMPYEQVKKLYPDELFAYIESTFILPDEMCTDFQLNKNDAKKSLRTR